MAVGTVSASNTDDIWQLISTASPSSASNTSFTSISGYKKLMVTYQLSANTESIRLRFNNDTTAGNYSGIALMYYNYVKRIYTDTYLPIAGYSDAADGGYVIFKDTDKTTPKIIEDGGGYTVSVIKGIYFGTSAITQVDVFPGSGTMTGTIKLYGVAA